MPPTNLHDSTSRPSAHALGRLSQGLAELDEAIRRLRHMGDDYDTRPLANCLISLSQHANWQRSQVNLDAADDQIGAVLRSLNLACMCLSRGTGWELWEDDAWTLMCTVRDFKSDKGLNDRITNLPPGGSFEDILTLSGLPSPDVEEGRHEVGLTMNLVIR